jgi:lipopolysaccharide export system permease protein
MLTLRQLNHNLDSLYKVEDSFERKLDKEIKVNFKYTDIPDSIWKKATISSKKINQFSDLLPDSARQAVFNQAVTQLGSLKSTFQFTGADWQNKNTEIRYSKLEWHRKFSFSLACLILFFIGAPLGSIIRKGGLGMPLVVAIIFFIFFHLLSIFGEKFAKEDVTPVFLGMWLAVFVLIPVGAFLTYKAMHDSRLFNKEFYYRFFKQIKNWFHSISKQRSQTNVIR